LISTTIGLLSSRDRKHRSGSKAKGSSASKRRPTPSGLSQNELLAKIDSLDWDETVTADTVLADGTAVNAQYPDHSTSSWRVAAIVAIIVCVMTVLYFVLAPEPASRPATGEASIPISAGSGSPASASIDNQAPVVAPEVSAAAVAAAEDRRTALYAHAIEEAEAKVQQKSEAREARRKAREARESERAKLAAQQDRERRQKEEARVRAERDAEEAARAAKAREQAALPKGPASPRELCAGEGGAIARGFCEAAACGRAEWRSHPFCVKRVEEQLRSLGQGG
jgi:hypothetical protein